MKIITQSLINCGKTIMFVIVCDLVAGDNFEEHLPSQLQSLASLTRQTHFSNSNKTASADHKAESLRIEQVISWVFFPEKTLTLISMILMYTLQNLIRYDFFFSSRAVCNLFGNRVIYLFFCLSEQTDHCSSLKMEIYLLPSLPKKSLDQKLLELRTDKHASLIHAAWFH